MKLNSSNFIKIVAVVLFFPVLFQQVFYDWELQNLGFQELEDYGSVLFVVILSFLESLLYTSLVWVGIFKIVLPLIKKKEVTTD